jgi:AraC-like DNA-binding protein
MKLEYAPPPGGLTDFVSAFYLFDANIEQFQDIERASIGQIRFLLAGQARSIYADGREENFPPASVFGPRSAATRVAATGPRMRLFGFGILPAGWKAYVGHPADECADQILPTKNLVTFDSDAIEAKIRGANTLEEMVEIIASLDLAKDQTALKFVKIVDDWLESSIDPDLDTLEQAVGLSRRQIERLTRLHYGSPPKFLVRKYRALRAANAIANGNGEWQDFIDQIYYDQSHFIRDIKEFTGLTPSALRDHASPLTNLAFGRSQLAGSVKPLVAST